ncbi:MAG: hypothetical protein NTW12_09975 [Deltaproteobacteria bacterium]|nr:hypothetical protein [Deltaproteobacteria bacterium]
MDRKDFHREEKDTFHAAKNPRESRWCEKYGYFIDTDACQARANTRSRCRRCIANWQQLTLPFPDFTPLMRYKPHIHPACCPPSREQAPYGKDRESTNLKIVY